MAQLSDDCFAFGGPLLSVEDALARIAGHVAVAAEAETVPLMDADGRVLAEGVAAPLPLPPFANSAVAGYAVLRLDPAIVVPERAGFGARVDGSPGPLHPP